MSIDGTLDRVNAAKISKIASPEQFKYYFIDEIMLLLGGAKVEKCREKDVSSAFSINYLFIYLLAFRVGFKFPFTL